MLLVLDADLVQGVAEVDYGERGEVVDGKFELLWAGSFEEAPGTGRGREGFVGDHFAGKVTVVGNGLGEAFHADGARVGSVHFAEKDTPVLVVLPAAVTAVDWLDDVEQFPLLPQGLELGAA